MLKRAGLWQGLSVPERLVLLAVSHELPRVSGLGVLGADVASITGFSRRFVEEKSVDLEQIGLLRLGWQPHMLYLSGDAVTLDLCGDKLDKFEEAEKPFSKRVVVTSTPLQPTA